MDWYRLIFELIDLRSFSNLWFWIALAVLWSSMSHWVLGVPFDMLHRARREGGQVQVELELLLQIKLNRMFHIVETSGLWLAGFSAFLLTTLLVLGFWYGIEFAQALFLLLSPMVLVMMLNLWAARGIVRRGDSGAALNRRLIRHRLLIQVIGMLATLVTAMYGMWQNMQLGPFG